MTDGHLDPNAGSQWRSVPRTATGQPSAAKPASDTGNRVRRRITGCVTKDRGTVRTNRSVRGHPEKGTGWWIWGERHVFADGCSGRGAGILRSGRHMAGRPPGTRSAYRWRAIGSRSACRGSRWQAAVTASGTSSRLFRHGTPAQRCPSECHAHQPTCFRDYQARSTTAFGRARLSRLVDLRPHGRSRGSCRKGPPGRAGLPQSQNQYARQPEVHQGCLAPCQLSGAWDIWQLDPSERTRLNRVVRHPASRRKKGSVSLDLGVGPWMGRNSCCRRGEAGGTPDPRGRRNDTVRGGSG